MPQLRLILTAMMLWVLSVSFSWQLPDAEAQKAKTVTMRYASIDAQQSWTGQKSISPWVADVEQATDGRIKFEMYWSNTLSKPMDNWESVKSGITDVADCVMSFWPGLAPLSDVISLPFIGVKTAEQGGEVFWRLYEKFPSIQAEFKDVHVLFFGVSNPNVLMTINRQVKTVEDIKGLKIRVTGGPPTTYLKTINASPMLVAMTDVYMNLQKGVIDGVVASWTSTQSMKFHEVIKYIANIPFYSPYAARVMNMNAWKRLPDDIRESITKVSGFERSKIFSRTQFDDHVALVREEGYNIIEYTPNAQELAQWQESAQPVWSKWVADMTAAGHPEAQEILDTTLELLKNHKP